MVVKKKRRDISDLGDLGLDDAPDFDMGSDDFGLSHDIPSAPSKSLATPESSLEKLSSDVVSALIRDGVPPLPNNFQLYFDRMLEELPDEVQAEIQSMMELEDSNSDEQAILLEQKIKGAFKSIQQLLQISSNLYKNSTLMARILTKRQSELSTVTDPTVRTVVKTLQSDITKLNAILENQISGMKTYYQSTAAIVEEVKQESIFDQQYGVYNKRYLLTKLRQEAKQIAQFKHQSTLISVTLTNELSKSVTNEKQIRLMERTVARLLMKTSRRSDIVAHYSNGVFAMLLKHTNLTDAGFTAKRILDLVQKSNFFLGEKEVTLSVNIGMSVIAPSREPEETLLAALDAMRKVSLDKNNFIAIYEQDQPSND